MPALAAHLELSRVHAIVALDERVPQVVDAVGLQRLQRAVVEVKVVGVAAGGGRGAMEREAACVRSGSTAYNAQAGEQAHHQPQALAQGT